jgi:hypothetical protein
LFRALNLAAADFNPVQCGANKCEYSNSCGATAAGFAETDCCPGAADGVVCTADFEPVRCGTNKQCEYSNQCIASAAGFENADCLVALQSEPMSGGSITEDAGFDVESDVESSGSSMTIVVAFTAAFLVASMSIGW